MTTTTLATLTSCLSDYDPNALSVASAQQLITQFITPLQSYEKLALRSALGRVLAADVISPINVPAHNNSAMDGYALKGDDLANGAQQFTIVGKSLAGHAYMGKVASGQAIRIMTGAVMPADCDTVIPQEFTEADSTQMRIAQGQFKCGDNRRLAGEDLAQGGIAIARGKLLRPADIGMLASLGIAEVRVVRRPRVAFFSTGDELRSVGEVLDEGCVYDSNRYTLHGMLTRLGCDILDMGLVRDDPASLEAALRTACENADAIITTGGVSVGEADFIKNLMVQLGEVAFWKINMRPGRPFAFGQISHGPHQAYLFGLPGNPVSAAVTFYLLVRDALLKLQDTESPLPKVSAALSQVIRKKAGRAEFMRGIAEMKDGQLTVRLTGAQGSGILSSMGQANCLLCLPAEDKEFALGQAVPILLFDGLA